MRWLALGAAGLMLAAACAGSSSNPASTTTITFWYLSDGAQADQVFQDAAKGFHAAHPDIEVEGTNLSSDTAYAKMLSALKGGGGPDAMEVSRDWVGAFSATGALHQLSSDEVQRLGGATAFVPGTWITDKSIAVPWFVDEKALYYRTDILRSVGLDPAAAFAHWDALQGTRACAPFPPGPAGRIVYAGGSDLAILAASKHESAAYEWTRWLAGQDGETSYVPRLSMYPALAAASDSMSNVQFSAFKAQVGAGKSFPAIASWSAIDSVLARYFAQVWNQVTGGGQPVPKDQLATILDNAATEMQAAIQQPS